jgi:hypothetical protein
VTASNGARYRWLVLAVFVLSTAINILDRATLAALARLLKQEFGLTNAQYGWIQRVQPHLCGERALAEC